MNREQVYKILDGERDYQDLKWGSTFSGNRPGNGDRSIDEFVLYMEGYMRDAVQHASHYADTERVLETLRKVAALAIRCFEQHGCPERKI